MKAIIRRTLTILLAAMMLCTFACAQTADVIDDGTTSAGTTESEATTAVGSLPDDLDFGGKKVTWFVRSDPPSPEYNVEEQTGDIVDDAIFSRNSEVCSRLNVEFEFYGIPGAWANRENFNQTIRASILANDAAYDILAGYSMCVASISTSGLLRDLAATEYIDLERPWWSDSLMEQSSVNGKLYFASGDISTNLLYQMYCVYFNKGMIEDYGLENPYELVEDNKWTIEKMFEMSEGVYNDLDGDGKKSIGDRFGTAVPYITSDAFFFSAGMNTTEIVDGVPRVSSDFTGEKVQDLLTFLCGQLHGSQDNYPEPEGEQSKFTFSYGNTLFGVQTLQMAKSKLRDVTFGYGILPMPKYDESQADYYTITGFPYSLYSIPIDAPDEDMSSAVLEALASVSYREVSPALFEVAMKVKYTTDDDSARMFDIIRDTIMFDFGRVFTDNLESLTFNMFRDSVRDDNTNWASTYEAKKSRLESLLSDVISSFE